MPKIVFDEKGFNFIELTKQNNNIIIVLSTKDPNNNRKTIVNSVEIELDQFNKIISDLGKEEENNDKSKQASQENYFIDYTK